MSYNPSGESPQHVDAILLTSTPATAHTVPAGVTATFQVEISNASGVPDAVTLWLVESGGSRTDTNKRLDAVTLGINTVPIKLGPYVLEASGTIQAMSTNDSNLSLQVSILDES